MQSIDDLNAAADLMATLYEEVAMLRVESLDLADVADGGDPLALTYTAAGAAGPRSDTPAIDGVCWSGVNPFDLTEVATHVGFLRGGVIQNTTPIDPAGPGPVPYVHGIGPMALTTD